MSWSTLVTFINAIDDDIEFAILLGVILNALLSFLVVEATLVVSLGSCSIAELEDCFTDLVEDYREFMVSI